ncbi:hypothetical protein [Arsukibacterium indicum]|uniref:ASCH domain-containing protein n=1 Tax=Arsukibacterium indicum TaxID=2848612 RepID=A0ABS6MH84_9GAMM|nr:hypothetical protein [Arsukibacterium indicum]MBV2128154.1 hypothetical protein [Arsukibacterium indicum]
MADQLPVIYGRSNTRAISLIIQAKTVCWWSHIGSPTPGRTVLEAVGGIGVVETPWHDFLNRYDQVITGWIYCRDLAEAYRFMYDKKGALYDKKAIKGILIGRAWDDLAAWHCSELIGGATHIWPLAGISQIWPKHLLKLTHDIERVK